MNNQYSPNYTAVQIALSTNCNLLCPGCNRTQWNDSRAINPLVKKNQFLDKQILFDFLKNKTSAYLQEIQFVGLVDDPLSYPYLLELLEGMLDIKSNLYLSFHTNASLRTPEYFVTLANILKKFSKHFVNFSIDGLEDTNYIYRVGSNWDKIMKNAEAFIGAGGDANWQFIVFPWNKHQEEDVKKLATKMGFQNIIVRHNQDLSLNDAVFSKNKSWLKQDNIDAHSSIEPSFEVFDYDLKQDNFYTPYNIECVWHDDRRIYISYDGSVWPCCYIAYDFFRRPKLLKQKFSWYEENFNNLYHYSIDEIMFKEPFSSDLLNSITSDNHGLGKDDAYFTCIITCSTRGFELIPSYHTHTSVTINE